MNKIVFTLLGQVMTTNVAEVSLLLAEAHAHLDNHPSPIRTRFHGYKPGQTPSHADSTIDGHTIPFDYHNRFFRAIQHTWSFEPFHDINSTIDRFNSTCIDSTNFTSQYAPATEGVARVVEAGLLASVLALRSQTCGYSVDSLLSYLKESLQSLVIFYETELLTRFRGEIDMTRAVHCGIEKAHDAIRRLEEGLDVASRGFLAVDACIPQDEYSKMASPIGVENGVKHYSGDLVEINYHASSLEDSTVSAWLVNPPQIVNNAQIFFNIISGTFQGVIDLLGQVDRFTLSINSNGAEMWLSLKLGCLDYYHALESPMFKAVQGWTSAGVVIRENAVTLSFGEARFTLAINTEMLGRCDNLTTTSSTSRSFFFGPAPTEDEGPSEERLSTERVVRFYGITGFTDPDVFIPLEPIKNQLEELGLGIPPFCHTVDFFESREGLTICNPFTASVAPRDQEDVERASPANADEVPLGQADLHSSSTIWISAGLATGAILLILLIWFKVHNQNCANKTENLIHDNSPMTEQATASMV